MTAVKRYYITTPIYYVNDLPHIGHAYTTLACDVMARFKRLDGYEVQFVTGTDEHGQKVEKSAKNSGIDPQTFTDKVSQNFRALAELLDFSNNDFIRTTEKRHKIACQALWERLLERGELYLGSYAGWYAVRDEAYYTESELSTDQHGNKVACSGAEVEWVEEPSYFFPLSKWQDRLLDFYEDNPNFILPLTRRNEVLSFVEGGLQDLSVSRTSFGWGVKVPNDQSHIMYVWLDALVNYITAAGFPDTDCERYINYWPADIHMVGKDILRFHAVFWPAFLMAAGLEPPKKIYAHGWWTNAGEKISKSLGNVISPYELVKQYGLDQVRYFLMREVPFGNDGDFSHQAMVNRMDGDLANDLGNLVQRVLSMVYKNCNARIPDISPNDLSIEDKDLLGSSCQLLSTVRQRLENQQFHLALEAIWQVIRSANGYVDSQAPWKLRTENPQRMTYVLYTLSESIRMVALLLQPFMPGAAAQVLDQLSIPADSRAFNTFEQPKKIKQGRYIPKPRGIFPRFQEKAI